ncbi:MAG TPA: ChbG/HpnK family deacetylase, partial [Chitinophagaceae bacterium]|nr:ChbG/HpnK family deacetylase [Chitinophagaceae bacterium]
GILRFLEAAEKSGHEWHSIMVLRHGKVVAEGWWNPYRPDLPHTMYSVSKSFTATAVGFAVAEKKLSVDDQVLSFFPEEAPAQASPNLARLRVRDLLTMTAGQQPDPTGRVIREQNWVRAFLNTPVLHEPGSRFLYNSAATYMLSAIVQKVTGQKLIDYLRPRLFDPLGIRDIDWETDPAGINVGGWGLRLKTEDMARFGQLFLQKGNWNGKQLLPAGWVAEATTLKIEQEPNASKGRKDSSDWLQGYAYQMWRSRNQSYRGDGAFGQYILVLPEKDAVIVATAETSDMQGELNLIWEHLLPALKDAPLPADRAAQGRLKEKLAALALPVPGSKSSGREAAVSGRPFTMITDRGLERVSLEFKDGTCRLLLDTDSADHHLYFAREGWKPGETTRYGPYLVAGAANNRRGLLPFRVAGHYAWTDSQTVELTLRYTESPHTETIRCSFTGDKISVDFIHLFNRSARRRLHTGIAAPAPAAPARLVVRGDDMGFSHAANLALVKAYQEGIETSIEVIAPSPWFPEAVQLLRQYPGVDVGLHFALTSEWDAVKWRPLTEAPSLRNADGYFYPMIYPNKNYPRQALMDNPWNLADIEKELRAQIELAKKHIPRLSHISGHMNSTGFSPEVRALCARVAKEYNLPLVDVDPEKNLQATYTGFPFRNKTTEERIEAFIRMLDGLEGGKTYVFVEHPGLDDPELRAISHIGYEDVAQERQDVTTLFTHERVKEALVRKGIRLVSYKDVISGLK